VTFEPKLARVASVMLTIHLGGIIGGTAGISIVVGENRLPTSRTKTTTKNQKISPPHQFLNSRFRLVITSLGAIGVA
jgi:hypothetical protein